MSGPESAPSSDAEILIRRKYEFTPEQVFDAWLNPAALGRWLFATPTGVMLKVEVDPRVGGEFVVIEQRGETRAEHFGKYLELDRPRRIVFAFATDRESKPTTVTLAIAPVAGGCELTLSHPIAPEWAAYTDRARAGWTRILEGLAATLMGSRELIFDRELNASPDIVYRAWTDSAQLARWWGPRCFTNPRCELDVRPGGAIRIDMQGPDGRIYPMTGAFRELAPLSRIVFASQVVDDQGVVVLESLTTVALAQRGGWTAMTVRVAVTQAKAEAVPYLAGMRQGWSQTLDRLSEQFPSSSTGSVSS